MSDSSHRLEIRCNAANPVLFLACCGLFDLLARIDPEARCHWHAAAPTACLLDTAVSEADFLRTLLDTFCAPACWGYAPPPIGNEPTIIHATFTPPGHPEFTVPLDWWFETAKQTGEVEDKSAWKMYAGQQTVEKITRDMVSEAVMLGKRGRLPATLTDLLAIEVDMSGRFGLDPRSSRNALNVGFSSNDLGLPVKTAPFAELLAVFGLASFFPGREGGWIDLTLVGVGSTDGDPRKIVRGGSRDSIIACGRGNFPLLSRATPPPRWAPATPRSFPSAQAVKTTQISPSPKLLPPTSNNHGSHSARHLPPNHRLAPRARSSRRLGAHRNPRTRRWQGWRDLPAHLRPARR